MHLSGVTHLSADHCFSELAIENSSSTNLANT